MGSCRARTSAVSYTHLEPQHFQVYLLEGDIAEDTQVVGTGQRPVADLRRELFGVEKADGQGLSLIHIFRVMPVLLYHECFQYIDKVETITPISRTPFRF